MAALPAILDRKSKFGLRQAVPPNTFYSLAKFQLNRSSRLGEDRFEDFS